MVGATQDKMTTKKNAVSMILDAKIGQNKSIMFYLKVKRYSTEKQETLTNMKKEKNDGNDKNNNGARSWAYQVKWRLMWSIGTNIWEKKLFRITYNTIGVKLIGTIQVFLDVHDPSRRHVSLGKRPIQ